MAGRNHNEGTRPGDIFLDRYMPRASKQEREAARENLRAFAAVMVRIAKRRAFGEGKTSRANGELPIEFETRLLPPL